MSGRIRTVKPEWLEDQLLSESSSDARVLSIGLLLLADDHGRGRASAKFLTARVFTGQSEQVLQDALARLVEIRYCHVYEVDGQKYFEVRNWFKHQKVDRPSKEKVPPPPETDSRHPREPSRHPREPSRDNSEPSRDNSEGSQDDETSDEIYNSRDPRETLARKRKILAPRAGPDPFPSFPKGVQGETSAHSGLHQPLRDRMAESLTGRRTQDDPDVLSLFDAWRLAHGATNSKFRNPADVRADVLHEAVTSHGMAACLAVLEASKSDGMVTGQADDKGLEHRSVEYIFQPKTFDRLLRAAEQARAARPPSALEAVRRAREAEVEHDDDPRPAAGVS